MSDLVIVLPMVFLAGFIDSIAGGGGLIALPAYLLAGIDMHTAMGTNKLSSSIGTLSASITYFMHKKILLKVAFFSAFFAFVGSSIGSFIALEVSTKLLEKVLIAIIPIMAILILQKRAEHTDESTHLSWVKMAVISLTVGMYDGFIGPGTGTLLIIGFVYWIKMSSTHASANAKIINLSSGIAAMVIFGFKGHVDYRLGLLAALFSIVGNVLGAHFTLKWGKKIIQPLLVMVLFLLMITLILEQFS